MEITEKVVEYAANLSRIELQKEELGKLAKQLQDILGFIDKLKKLDVGDISPTSHILPVNNVLREDQPKDSLLCDKALTNAPHREGNFFGVPKVIE